MGLYDYSLESELRASEPRRVSLTRAAVIMRVFLATALLVSIILTADSAAKDIRHLRNLVANCRPIQGEITGQYSTLNRHDTAYYLNYAYTVANHTYRGVEKVSHEYYDLSPMSSPITLAYLPRDPRVHFVGTITDDTMREGIENWIVRGLVIVGFFAIFALGNELGLRNQVYLLRCGKTARASVISAWARRGNWGPSASSVSYRITCSFWTGQEEVSKQFIVSGSMYGRIHVGDHITVVFDRRKPQNCLPYGAFNSVYLTS